VVIASTRRLTTTYAVVISNLGDVAIEGIAFELLDPISGRPTSGQGADYCGTDAGTTTGRIGGKNSRKFPLNLTARELTNPPIARLTLVMFDDLSYEGSTSRRADILAARERDADDIRYVIRVRAEAASKIPAELPAFLKGKRLGRAKALGVRWNRRGCTIWKN